MSLIFFLKSRVFQLLSIGSPLKTFLARARDYGARARTRAFITTPAARAYSFLASKRSFTSTGLTRSYQFRAREREALIGQPAQRTTLIRARTRTFNFTPRTR